MEEGKGRRFTACSNVSRVILTVVNLLILAFGIFVIYGGAKLVSVHYFEDISTEVNVDSIAKIVSVCIIVAGAIIVGIALLGFYAAYKGNGALTCWNFCMFIVLVLIILLAIVGWAAFGYNQWWKARPYPNSDENEIADPFNEGYCKAQALGLCYSSEGLVEVAKNSEFLPADVKSAVDLASSALKDMTLQDACKIPLIKQISSTLSEICTNCESYQQYGGLLKFANDQCPLNADTAAYCTKDVFGLSSGPGESPYEHCRPILLHSWLVYSLALAIPATIVGIAVLVAMILACTIKKKEVEEEYIYENQNPPYVVNNNNGAEYYT